MARLSIDSLEELRGSNILVAGVGGGGDALGALLIALRLRAIGVKTLIGSIVWERFIIDPYPGPIPLEQLVNGEVLGRTVALVERNSYVDRYGYRFKPQIVRVSEVLGEKTLFLDISRGVMGLVEAFNIIGEKLGIEAIIGVDVGGDVLALGCEDELWSPLADSISLGALYKTRMPAVIAVLAPGADGELSQQKVLRRIGDIAKQKGLIGVYGIARREYNVLRKYIDIFLSEASKIPFIAFEGFYGEKRIRLGSRTVEVSPVSTTFHILDVNTVYETTTLAKITSETNSVEEARENVNRYCVYTELDLESDVYKLRLERGALEEGVLLDVRREGRRRLLLSGCTPLTCPSS